MKTRLSVILGLITLAVFGFGNIARAQNEVTESITSSFYGTSKVIPLGPDRVYMTFELFGVSVSDTGQGLFHNATNHVIVAIWGEKGNFTMEGAGFYTLKDGEKVFVTTKSSGKTGIPAMGTSTIVGGTGKYSGIQGRQEYTSYSLRPSAEGILQSYNKTKIIYKLP